MQQRPAMMEIMGPMARSFHTQKIREQRQKWQMLLLAHTHVKGGKLAFAVAAQMVTVGSVPKMLVFGRLIDQGSARGRILYFLFIRIFSIVKSIKAGLCR
jgi:hypothetical protein